MGAIGGLLGTAGGAAGSGFAGPQQAKITAPVTQDQANAAQTGVTNSLGGSDALLAALGGQKGIQNQSDVYGQGQAALGQINGLDGTGLQQGATNAQQNQNIRLTGLGMGGTNAMKGAMTGQTGLNNALGNANGVGIQSGAVSGLQDVMGQQQGVANQYQNIANGTGPNPAQAALNNATGANVANQAAMMAGQRGAGANVGLMARQAGQQGANIQQQAVGQSALMQAQQQLAGLSGLGGAVNAMGGTQQAIGNIGAGLTGAQQAGIANQFGQGSGVSQQLQTGIGQQYGQGAGIVGQGQAQQGINAGIAGAQVGNLANATNANVQGNLANSGNVIGARGGYNTSIVNSQGNVNTNNAGLAQTQMKGNQDMMGGLMNAAGGAMGLSGGAGGAGGAGKTSSGSPPGGAPDTGTPDSQTSGGDPGVPAVDSGPNSSGGTGGGPASGGDYGGGDNPGGYQGPTNSNGQPMAEGGLVSQPTSIPMASAPTNSAQSSFGQFLSGAMNTGDYVMKASQEADSDDTSNKYKMPENDPNRSKLYNGTSKMAGNALTEAMAKGGMAHNHNLRSGGKVVADSPKEKAVSPGDSRANDKIPAMLSEGEIVIPREVLQGKDPARNAADFVAKVLAKRGRK